VAVSRRERRERVVTAFEELRAAIATARGAADTARRAAEVALARARFEVQLRDQGLAALRRSASMREQLDDPDMAAPLNAWLADRRTVFDDWVSTEPDSLVELVAAAAPGTAGEPWQNWLGEPGKGDGGDPVPALWRIGTARVADAPVHRPFPVAVPLLDESHLEIRCTAGTRAHAEALVESLLMRVVSQFRPGMVALHVWDVGQLTGSMPGLYPLTRTGLLTVHHPGRLDELLEELSEHIRRVHTRVLVDGHASLRELAATTGTRSEPWRIAVLVGGHAELRDEDRRALQRVARNGLACGIQLLLMDVPVGLNAPVEHIAFTENPEDPTATPRVRTSMTGEFVAVTLDDPLPREQVATACHAISDEMQRVRSRVSSFADLVPLEPADWWRTSSTNGVSAAVGFRDGRQVELHLCDASPHALIGGPSGSGKTNFLFTMIGSMAARYSPDELELYLLDFKEGVSFAQFTPGRRDPSWLPHARLVGVNINTDREFGLALLRFLSEEMRRRAEAAKANEVTKLEELRAADPHGRWPRIVAVIDEFQYLFAERDQVTKEATTLLENVARRGRSQGIHLVLSSQDVSGIEAFWGRPAIFEQFVLRVALPRARRVLADLNDVALTLPRWHAVLNHESGFRHGNEIAKVPDATARGTFDSLQHDLWQRRPPELAEPRLFDAGRAPALAELTARLVSASAPGAPAPDAAASGVAGLSSRAAGPTAVLGQLIDVAGLPAVAPMTAIPGRNLAVISSSVADAASVLGAAAVSLAAQHEPGDARFTVVALVPDAEGPVRTLAARLRGDGHSVETAGLAEVAELIAELAGQVTGKLTGAEGGAQPHYLLLYGADGASGVLDRKDPTTLRSGLDSLRQLLRSGPETGLHVLGWWRSVQRLRAVLTMGAGVDDVGCWVAFDVQGSELGTLAPGLVHWSPRPRRGLVFDRNTQRRPEVLIVPDISELEGGP
jgi:DNA translocase FtsK/SpoIIIE-like protein